jgi:hypothetical protein
MKLDNPKWWGPATTCFFVLWFALLACGPAKMLGDPGTLWHTVVGERMLQSGELVRTDSFSFTCQGQPWIAQQWLGEIAMALLYRLGKLDALVLAAVTLLAATYALLAGRFFRAGLPWLAAAVLITLVIAASSYHFLPRPHIVTIALMAGMFGLLSDIEAGRRSPHWLLILPVLYVVWTNIHGGALGGIATSTLVLLAWLGWHHLPWARRRGNTRPVAGAAIIGLVAGLSFVAVLVNPYGPALPRVWVSLMSSKVLPELIVEHAPLQILSTEGAMILALAGVYLALLATTWRHGPRVTWLVPLIWLALTLGRIRHGPLFAVTAAVAIAEMLPYSPLAARFLRGPDLARRPASERDRISLRPALIPALAVAAALVLQANAVACPLIGAGWSRLRPDHWPLEATRVLRQHIRRGQAGVKVFNDLGMGGYLIFSAPAARVYIDDRCELYRDDGLRRYRGFLRDPQLIDSFAAYEGIDLALTRTRSRFDRHFAASPAWSVLHRDHTASLYTRVKQTDAETP